MHNVPRFDAHIEVYGADKSVRVQYDTPYVRGLPVTMRICEKDGRGEYRETTVRKTYEDAYTAELRVWWEVVMGRRRAKTTVEDAMHDLELFSMAVKSHYG